MLLAKTIIRLTTLLVLVCLLTTSKAQINSPFSRYGLGNEILNNQNATSQGMGGFSTAFTSGMNGTYGQSINFSNPASYGSFILTTFDLGLNYNSTTLTRNNPIGKEKSAYLVPNYLAIGVPINKAKKIGFAFGLQPITRVNYSVNETKLSVTGDSIYNNYMGSGGMNQVFFGFGKIWKRLSFGFNTGYNFGRKNMEIVKSLSYNTDSTYFYQTKSSLNTIYGGLFLKLGMLGELPLKTVDHPAIKEKTEYTLSFGATYTLDQKMRGKQDLTRATGSFSATSSAPLDTAISTVDTRGTVQLPSFISAGIAFHKKQVVVRGTYDQWVVGLELNTAAWKNKYQFYGQPDLVSNSWMFRAGVQYNPNAFGYDNYWNTVIYRIGFFTGKDYLNIDDNGMKVNGLTLGLGLPIRKYRAYDYQYTLINLAFQTGQRGSSVNNYKESFMNLTVGYSLSDLWFNKRKYD